jgi:hypothetical protein
MPYEVVDPAEPEAPRRIFASLTDAMVNAGPYLEVWELDEADEDTRLVRCWPDPEHEPAAPRLVNEVKDAADQMVALAERTAAEHAGRYVGAEYPDVVCGLTAAFLMGVQAGMQATIKRMDGAIAEVQAKLR